MESVNKNDESRKVFGQRLKKLRNDKDLTLQELSSKLQIKYDIEISFSSIGNYERGYRIPELFLLTKLADFFDVSTDYLLGITDVKNAKVLQTSIFDENNIKREIKIGVDKDSDLANMTYNEIKEFVLKLKSMGINFDKIN